MRCEPWGTPDGRAVELYTLTNATGTIAAIALLSPFTPDVLDKNSSGLRLKTMAEKNISHPNRWE